MNEDLVWTKTDGVHNVVLDAHPDSLWWLCAFQNKTTGLSRWYVSFMNTVAAANNARTLDDAMARAAAYYRNHRGTP